MTKCKATEIVTLFDPTGQPRRNTSAQGSARREHAMSEVIAGIWNSFKVWRNKSQPPVFVQVRNAEESTSMKV